LSPLFVKSTSLIAELALFFLSGTGIFLGALASSAMVADDDEVRLDLAVAVMAVAASLSMVFALLEASIFLGGISFPVGGVSSIGLEVVDAAAACVTGCVT
jgi:hypothetical protein